MMLMQPTCGMEELKELDDELGVLELTDELVDELEEEAWHWTMLVTTLVLLYGVVSSA